MKLFLHIGTAKTGTTNIQEFLRKNKEHLKKQDILIPSSIFYNGNHRWLPVFAYEKNFEDDFTATVFKNKSALRQKLIYKKLKEFKQEISGSNAKICIISSEHLSFRLKTKKDIGNLKKILDELFDEISIILYIREPMSGAISMLSTGIRQGNTFDGIDSKWYSNLINNLNIIKTWENIFSKNNFKIKLFEKVEFVNDDLIQDFCCECNIKITSSFTTSNKENKTLSLDQLKYLNYLNQYFPRFINGRVNQKRGKLTDFIIKNFQSSNFFLPTNKEYLLFQENFADDNDFIKREYFPNKKQLWSPYKKGFAEKENIINELSKREIEFLNAIKELWLQRKLSKLNRSDLLKKFFNKIKMLLCL